MNNNLTELIFILDKSGSMCGLEKDTLGGYNALIKKQKQEEGEALVSTVLFSTQITLIHDRVNLKEVGVLTEKEYFTEGCTALLDAIGTTVQRIKHIQDTCPESDKPSKTLCIITTDGYENSSCEYNYKTIKQLIEDQKERGWEFIFLGANIDAVEEAAKFGIERDNAVNYNCDSRGINLNYEALDCAIKSVRETGCMNKAWRKSIDKDVKARKK